MIRFLALLLVVFGFPLAATAVDSQEEQPGFISLFDGETFDGWDHEGNWVIRDGAFHRRSGGGPLTYTAAEVPDDFELRFQWRASEGCNSGVYYRPGQVEYQVLDDANSPYGDNPRQSAASLFFCIGPDRDVSRPHGQWNTGRVVCKGTVIEHWLNGERVISFDYADPRWKFQVDLLAIRGGDLTGRGGNLWLQDHGQDVSFRNLRWRTIPEDEAVHADPNFGPLPVTGQGLAKEQARVRRMLAARRNAAPRPNVVVIMADDLGWGDVGCYGPSPIPTPNIDAIAARGLRFTDAHSPSAICSATRYGLLTGTDPCRRYHTSHVMFNGEPLVIAEGEGTVASVLADAGYRTGVVGKWHVGLGDSYPRDLNSPGRGAGDIGFDRSFLVADGHNMFPKYYIADGKPHGDAAGAEFPSELTVIDRLGYKLLEHRPHGEWPDYRPDERIGATLVDQSVRFLESAVAGDSPFFFYLPTCAIHTPHVTDPRFRGKSSLGNHGDFVMEFDWLVGEVVATLERLGLSEETLIVVTSDNGGLPGAQRLGHDTSGPWSGFKGSSLEGGHRVPMIAAWPGKIAAGETTEALFSLTDITATAAALAGGFVSPQDAADSFDQSAVLLGRAESVRDSLTVATRGCQEIARREGPHKLTLRPDSDRTVYVNLEENPTEESATEPADGEQAAAMLARLHAYFGRGASRPGAVAKGTTVRSLQAEKDERNAMILERLP